jgi:hypothetical protein
VVTGHCGLIALSFVFWLCLGDVSFLWCLILGFLDVRRLLGDVRLFGYFILGFLVALRFIIRIVLNG